MLSTNTIGKFCKKQPINIDNAKYIRWLYHEDSLLLCYKLLPML